MKQVALYLITQSQRAERCNSHTHFANIVGSDYSRQDLGFGINTGLENRLLENLVRIKDLETLGFQTSWDALGFCPVCEFEEEVAVIKFCLSLAVDISSVGLI